MKERETKERRLKEKNNFIKKGKHNVDRMAQKRNERIMQKKQFKKGKKKS